MFRNWQTWTLCLLIFLAGVTWGSIKLKTEFYVVDNIHDLFEIFSSAATVAAVILAAASINTWRKQISAESDHEMARALVIALEKHKERIQSAHSDAMFCVNNCEVGFEVLPQDLLSNVVGAMLVRIEKTMEEVAEIRALVIEARALWGDEISKSLDEYLNACNYFYGPVRLFSAIVGPEALIGNRREFTGQIISIGQEIKDRGWVEGKIIAKASQISQSANKMLREKLLR